MSLRLTHVAPGVHRLSSVSTNWYLVEDGGRLTVLDAGFPRDWREFVSALSRLGHPPADGEAVLITHPHRDHAGNAERLRTSGARVLSHPADAPFLRGEEHLSDAASCGTSGGRGTRSSSSGSWPRESSGRQQWLGSTSSTTERSSTCPGRPVSFT